MSDVDFLIGDHIFYNGEKSVVVGKSRGDHKVYSVRVYEGGIFQKVTNIPGSSLSWDRHPEPNPTPIEETKDGR